MQKPFTEGELNESTTKTYNTVVCLNDQLNMIIKTTSSSILWVSSRYVYKDMVQWNLSKPSETRQAKTNIQTRKRL